MLWNQTLRLIGLCRQEGPQLRVPSIESGALLIVISVAVVDPRDPCPCSADMVEHAFCHLDGDSQRLEMGCAGSADIVQPPVWNLHLCWVTALLDLLRLQICNHVLMERRPSPCDKRARFHGLNAVG